MKKRLTALAAERAIAQSAISSQCRHPVASPATTRFGRGVAITLADASSSSRAVAAPAVTSHSRIVLSEEPEASRPSGSTHRAATRPECPSRRAVSAQATLEDGSQVFDLQRDALLAAGVEPSRLYQDQASGKKDDRPGLEACLKSMREDDTLIVWKLDRLGRNLRHLVNTIHELMERKIGFRVLAGQGANIDTTTASGRLVFGIFAALAEFERELIRERTIAGLSSARARGRNGGRPYSMTPAKLRLAQAAMTEHDTKVGDLCKELGVTRQTLYRFVGPKGELRPDGAKLLERNRPQAYS